jgi:DNA-binding transcriptional LysR family regulator
MQITLRQLSIFESVARHSSISLAAKEMHLTQPAVSMQMKQLEDSIGVPLLEQNGRRLYLTEAGQELRGHAQRFVAQTFELQSAMDQFRGLERGLLRIAVVSTANYFLPPLIAAYSERYPGVRVILQVGNRETVLASLTDHRTDLAILGEPPAGVDVEAKRFMDNPLVVIANPGHPLKGLEQVSLARLHEERLLMREPGSGTRAAAERHFAKHKVDYILGCELNTNESIKQAVQAGLGLGVVSLQTIDLELETGRLVVLPVESFPIIRHWFIVHRRDKRLSPASQAFRELMLAQVSPGPLDPPSSLGGKRRTSAEKDARRDAPSVLRNPSSRRKALGA